MNEWAVSWARGSLLAVATGWTGYLFGVRQERERERRARNHTAAARLTGPLRELQRLLRWLGREELDKAEVTAAFLSWSKAYDDQGHRIPRGWRHVDRSVRDATGTVFGGVSLVHIRPDTARLRLGDPGGMWQDYADEFLGYVARCILEWGDSSHQAPKDLLTYEEWLVRTGRRESYGKNGPQGIESPASTV